MSLFRSSLLLAARALRQFPRMPAVLVFSMVPPLVQLLLFGALFKSLERTPGFPVENYYTYLAPAVVLFTTVIGIGNASVALVTDFESRYFYKLLVSPVSMWSILLGRLLSDGARVFLQSGVILALALPFGATLKYGIVSALGILTLSTVFSILSVGALTANIALKTKSQQGVQAIFPVFFIGIFLTSAFNTRANMPEFLRILIYFNPAQYIVDALHDLAFRGFDLERFLIAVGVTLGLGIIAVVATLRNYRNVYA